MPDLTVCASRRYDIIITEDMRDFSRVHRLLKGDKVAVVTDANVAPLYADAVRQALSDKQVFVYTLPAGEQYKTLAQYGHLLNALADWRFTRQDGIVALGGGVVGDLAAFAASTYMRGIALVAVPTSLLAMVDSSVGGKTAVNLDSGKNLCGTFYQPYGVYVNTGFLRTLPQREMACGWGEIVKYAFLSDTLTMADLTGDVTPRLIAKCLQIKADIVAKDERENGLRKLLNLGHTIGHAVERLSDFSLSHGDCVAKGMAAILDISRAYYGMSDDVYRRAKTILESRGHDLSLGYEKEAVLQLLGLDKKAESDGVDAVLISPALQAEVVHLSWRQLRELWV